MVNCKNRVGLKFIITQHSRDSILLNTLIDYFGCGRVNKHGKNVKDFVVTKFSDIKNIIIPFFKNYPVMGVKYKDFKDWMETAELIDEKKHLTLEGLEKIKIIKNRMNKSRSLDFKDNKNESRHSGNTIS